LKEYNGHFKQKNCTLRRSRVEGGEKMCLGKVVVNVEKRGSVSPGQIRRNPRRGSANANGKD